MDDIWKMPRNIYVDKEMNDDIVYVTTCYPFIYQIMIGHNMLVDPFPEMHGDVINILWTQCHA